ncbi:Myb/SANT-like DNA-binding domain [Sesbania bispinosa]|nr:Myb/SANT-like DNA-binding domain [Sesbania bispinosa]
MTMKTEDDLEWHPKRQKVKSLISTYAFAPRVAAPSAATPSAPKPSFVGRNSLTDWTEHETFILLDAWGERFLQHGRKSLRSEEWQEVAEKVSKFQKLKGQILNGLDEKKDSPENTESIGEEDSDGPQAKKRRKGRGNGGGSSFRLLADSIKKFSKIYEKIENSKRQQMVELEKMRMDFLKDLEMQKRQIVERLQGEISKLEQRDDNDDSAENGM